jgi:hypothetical protein
MAETAEQLSSGARMARQAAGYTLGLMALGVLGAPEVANAGNEATQLTTVTAGMPDMLGHAAVTRHSHMSPEGVLKRIYHNAQPDDQGWHYEEPSSGSIRPNSVAFKTNCQGGNTYSFHFYKRNQHELDYRTCGPLIPRDKGPATSSQYKSGTNSIGHKLEESVGLPREGKVSHVGGSTREIVANYNPSTNLEVHSVKTITLVGHTASVTYY